MSEDSNKNTSTDWEDPSEEVKEIAHYLGGWDALRELINTLEQNDNEAMGERYMNRH